MSVLTETLPVEQQATAHCEHDLPPRSPTSEAPPSKRVKWEVEDPSEFRPGVMDNLGKDKEDFRGFRNVCTSVHGRLGQHKEVPWAAYIKMEVGLFCYCLHNCRKTTLGTL